MGKCKNRFARQDRPPLSPGYRIGGNGGDGAGLFDFRRLQGGDAVEQFQIQAVADGLRQLVVFAVAG